MCSCCPCSQTQQKRIELDLPYHKTLYRLFGARKTLCPPGLQVTLCQPFAGLDKLYNVDELLAQHDGEADDSNNPRDGGVLESPKVSKYS